MAKSLLRVVKSIIFWRYDRGTWQYDVLAALIIILILFSSRFDSLRGKSCSWLHQLGSPAAVSNPVPPDQPGADAFDTKPR